MTLAELDRRYPFDPSARVENLRGLDKLRAVPDRELALVLYELHKANEKRWATEEHKARQRAAYARQAPPAEPDVRQRQAGER